MKTLEAHYRISAPLFMSGMDKLSAGNTLRPSAIKGALRFWWRALNWGRVRNGAQSELQALQHLREQESALFGSTAKQSAVMLRLRSQLASFTPALDTRNITYLLGQGLYQKKQLTQSPLTGACTLTCLWREDSLNDDQVAQLQQAVLALGLLGGVGARARKGFGSLSIQSLTVAGATVAVPDSPQAVARWLGTVECASSDEPAPFSAWSARSRCWQLFTNKQDEPVTSDKQGEAVTLLVRYDRAMRRYRMTDVDKRSVGRGIFRQATTGLLRFANDGTAPATVPGRAVFGLPNNVYFSHIRANVEVLPEEGYERRASPVLAHVHHFPGNPQPVMLATLLPAQFLPEQASAIRVRHNKKDVKVPFTPDWNILTDFVSSECQPREVYP